MNDCPTAPNITPSKCRGRFRALLNSTFAHYPLRSPMNDSSNCWRNQSYLAIVLILGVLSAQADAAESFKWHEGEGTRTLKFGDVEWFTYQYLPKTFEKVPEDDTRRTRGCYIHTLRGLHGEILTQDAPNDHVHHHGIFWAWPHVKIDGVEHRLWERPDIFQKFEKWLKLDADEDTATLSVQNGWYLGEKKVMTERLEITAYPQRGARRYFDLSLTITPVDKPVTLRGAGGKSYGGVTLRMNVWPRKDGAVTSPEGVRRHVGNGLLSKEDLSNKSLKWAALTTSIPDGPERSGVAIMVPPSHPNYPPTWLTRCYGALCVGWPGVEEQTLPPGKPVTLAYRFRIYHGEPNVKEMAETYQHYLNSLPE